MAEVFLATKAGFGGFERQLCIKRIRPEFAGDELFVRLLIDEAKLTSGLNHPNVAQVFDLGQVDGLYYIAIEYVDGIDLFKLLNQAGEAEVHIPVGAAALVALKIARALQAAHTHTNNLGQPQNIVHRDVSPHNVLLSGTGDVKLIDFGIAKAKTRLSQTEVGVIKGKYNYLAPEQATGGRVDARTDIFALGILLYEMLAGTPLYAGNHIAALLDQARRVKIPSLRKWRSDVPAHLSKIMRKCLKKKPEQRYESAQAVVADLEAFTASRGEAYKKRELAHFIEWLPAQSATPSDPPTPTPEEKRKHVFEDPRVLSSGQLDSAPTQIANPLEIASRRKARASGHSLQPVPVRIEAPLPATTLPPAPKPRSSLGLIVMLIVLAIACLVVAIALNLA
jgi:serine/threonine protein kinase